VATFTVWKFDDPEGALRAEAILASAAADGLVTVVDRALVSWPNGAKRPTTQDREADVERGAGWGAFWGLLLGALFFVPVVGAAAGAGVGALSKTMARVGITKEQMDTLRWQIREGTSALFVLSEDADLEAVGQRFCGSGWVLIDTNLTDVETARLLGAFGHE
jgi:uncharacterized membrane protein